MAAGSGRVLKSIWERLVSRVLFTCAFISVAAVLLISVFIFKEGLPALNQVGVIDFIMGTEWAPGRQSYGILPMIAGSLLVTSGALIFGVPTGIATAIVLAEFAPKKLAGLLRSAVELLAGIPSVVYGFFGLALIVPAIRNIFGGTGFSALAGAVILAVMILPTVINISEDAIRSVPREFKEGSLALGATDWQTIWRVILPAAKSGIAAGIVLAMGRAIGETMAVIMVTGNTAALPGGDIPAGLLKPLKLMLEPVRTLTGNVVLEMGYATGLHQDALFATGIVLFVMIMLLNLMANAVIKGRART